MAADAESILRNLSPAALAAANEANMCAAYRWFATWPEGELIEDERQLIAITGVPHPLFNGVFRVRLPEGEADAEIDAALAHLRRREVPAYWWIGPGAQPADLEARLEAHGLPYDGEVPGMSVGLQQLPQELPVPAGLEITAIRSPEEIRRQTDVLMASFGMPDFLRAVLTAGMIAAKDPPGARFINYQARLEGRPVAATSLLLAAGVAGVYNVGTVPDARGKGIAAAIVAHALRAARDAGYRAGILQSSEMGFRVYQRLGFHQTCTFRHHVLEG